MESGPEATSLMTSSTPFSVKNLLNLSDQSNNCSLDFPPQGAAMNYMGHHGAPVHGGPYGGHHALSAQMDGLTSHALTSGPGPLSIDAVVNHVVNSSCEYGGSSSGSSSTGMLQQPLSYPSTLTDLNQGGMASLRMAPDYHLPPHSLSPPVSSPSPLSQQCREELVRELTSLDRSKYHLYY